MFSSNADGGIEKDVVNGHVPSFEHPMVEPQRSALQPDIPRHPPSALASRKDGHKSPFDAIAGEGHVLIGKGTKIMGDIRDCTLVEIQGVLEGTIMADAVIIREGGGFKGVLQTDHAEVHGVLEGTVVVHELLDIRANGHVQGELTYGRITIADGGFVSGSLQTKSGFEPVEAAAHDGAILVDPAGGRQN